MAINLKDRTVNKYRQNKNVEKRTKFYILRHPFQSGQNIKNKLTKRVKKETDSYLNGQSNHRFKEKGQLIFLGLILILLAGLVVLDHLLKLLGG